MAINKYDKFGFDKFGYNKDGFDRMGYNREGYDRLGFDRNGLNKKGINKLTGRDKDGYDSEGFNEAGYDREGFDKEGYDAAGYNREGFNHSGYDRDGFDSSGFNAAGYDREGYDWSGFNRIGYDREGYDRKGFDKKGFDRDGFNRQGYDRFGFNKSGFNAEGYNREGYDQNGYDRKGFDRDGYDREGYNKLGFDARGYDKEGYDRNGYDSSGYDRNGYDLYGYDKGGFNADGINKDGYNRDGLDAYGFDRDGKNTNGFDLNGFSDEGFSILGYDADGFDENGLSLEGFSRDSFDDEGFHIYSGYNLKGFDREGYNINGVDAEGYDRDGYHFISGLDRNGFDQDGFNAVGYDKDGYNRKGYNLRGYDRDGYDINGFNLEGYDRRGFDYEGYNRRGYDVNGYDRSGILDPEIKKEFSRDVDQEQDRMEAAYHKKCEYQITHYYKNQVEKEERKDNEPIVRTYVDRWGFVQSLVTQPDEENIRNRINNRVEKVLQEPYFCHVDYSSNPELYIGRQAVHGWITDWADERASLYYQYQMYIGNKDTGLNYVRDINIKKRKYEGYKDLYNRIQVKNGYASVADKHLAQIIQANQKSKKIHDIIESIQENQYTIITSDKEKPSIVLGCAGSGKTMILMHKIRYMKYNYRDLKMNQVMVISPTDILGKESRELSSLLQIDQVRQYTTSTFYEETAYELIRKLGIRFEQFHVLDGVVDGEDYLLERIKDRKKIIDLNLRDIKENGAYSERHRKALNELIDAHIELSGIGSKLITDNYRLYTDSIEQIRKAGKKDIERLINQIRNVTGNKESLEDLREVVRFLYNSDLFKSSNKSSNNRPASTVLLSSFTNTRKALEKMNIPEFLHVLHRKHDLKANSMVEAVQIMQLFITDKLDIRDVRALLFELNGISKEAAKQLLDYADESIERSEKLERKQEILQYLLDNEMVSSRAIGNNNLRYDTAFDKLVKLFDNTEEKLGEIGYTPFQYFSEYRKLLDRRNRFREQKKNPSGKHYLFDAILDNLHVKSDYRQDIYLNQTDAFILTYILMEYAGPVNLEKRYIYIDEFQDFAPLELEMMQRLYPRAIFNLFGDTSQCISLKGIRRESQIPSFMKNNKPYVINENYRNAKQITNYINSTFRMNMLAVGLDGIQRISHTIPDIDISEDDRVAIIVVNDNSSFDLSTIEHDVNFFKESKDIVRGKYNVIPVAYTKGLEFEKVIVIREGMTNNEFYVACTRAISELYVVV